MTELTTVNMLGTRVIILPDLGIEGYDVRLMARHPRTGEDVFASDWSTMATLLKEPVAEATVTVPEALMDWTRRQMTHYVDLLRAHHGLSEEDAQALWDALGRVGHEGAPDLAEVAQKLQKPLKPRITVDNGQIRVDVNPSRCMYDGRGLQEPKVTDAS